MHRLGDSRKTSEHRIHASVMHARPNPRTVHCGAVVRSMSGRHGADGHAVHRIEVIGSQCIEWVLRKSAVRPAVHRFLRVRRDELQDSDAEQKTKSGQFRTETGISESAQKTAKPDDATTAPRCSLFDALRPCAELRD